MSVVAKDRIRILLKLNDMTQYIRELREMLPEEDEYQQDLVRIFTNYAKLPKGLPSRNNRG